jgi:transposase
LEVHGITWELLPPYSPDLNTIKHLWFRLKEETHRLHLELLTMGGSVDTKKLALRQAMLDGWEVVRADRELLRKLAESRRRRLDAVRVTQRSNTRY